MNVRYTIEAKRQLIEIWRHSRQHWGDKRTDEYILEIDRQLEAVASGRRRARACPDIAPGLSVIRSGSHRIFVRIEQSEVRVIAVLHQRMDAKERLK